MTWRAGMFALHTDGWSKRTNVYRVLRGEDPELRDGYVKIRLRGERYGSGAHYVHVSTLRPYVE